MKKMFNYLKNNIVITCLIIFSIIVYVFLDIEIFSIFSLLFGTFIGVWLTDRQERKRIKREQENTLSYLVIYLTLVYRRIFEIFRHINYMDFYDISFNIPERLDKNDFKIFDREYDTVWFPRFQYLIDELKDFINKIKSTNQEVNDLKLLIIRVDNELTKDKTRNLLIDKNDENEISNENEVTKEFVRLCHGFIEVSRELKKNLENKNIKGIDDLLNEFEKFETFSFLGERIDQEAC
ncbi:MAG: hypothetical protein LBN01_02730 [Endomicrobium sp.]|jgi:hypothetical protein|nr:hypothetical protein [Endomicrobium sp.]